MSYTVKSNKVYANINDLPQDYAIKNGDKLIVQRNDETYIVDYSDVMIDLEHVSFHETFTEMVNFTSNCTAFINEIGNSFNELSESVSEIKSRHTEIIGRLDAIEAILKLIYACDGENQTNKLKELMSTEAKTQFDRMFNEISTHYYSITGVDFTFTENNFASRFLS